MKTSHIWGSPTVENTLPVVVGLGRRQFRSDKFPVNLVLDIRKKDKRCDNTSATAGLQLRRDLAIPHIVVVGKQGADGVWCHGQKKVPTADERLAAGHPVGLASIAQILGVGLDRVEVIPIVRLALADGSWRTRVEGCGGQRIAPAEAVGSHSTFSILCIPSFLSAMCLTINPKESKGRLTRAAW